MTQPPEIEDHKASFDRHMIEALVCPITHQALSYDATAQELISKAAGLVFPVRNGVPIMILPEARPYEKAK